jgi:hypothetical protein
MAADVFEVETYEVLVVSVLTAGLDVLGGHIVPSGLAVGRDLAGERYFSIGRTAAWVQYR